MEHRERDRLADALLEASRVLLAVAVRSVSAGSAEVTVVQHRVLVLLDAHRLLSVNAVADELGIDQSNASRHCTRLARLGLVTRTRATHDGRAVDLALTTAGRQHVRAVRAARRREITRLLADVPDSDVREMTRAFELFGHASGDRRAALEVI
jgi:DNA-binding MarR family transcriptional regulator